jgi:TusA-related sulfurtransferase/ketosteroid isomerase-like protein
VDAVESLSESWIQALVRRDFDALRAALTPGVQFRALVPGEPPVTGGRELAADCFRSWFGDKTDIEILDKTAATLVDRAHIRFRARVRKHGLPYVIEQSFWGDVEDGRFATIDLLCSGFRPAGVAAGTSTHVFDAGDLGCGTGLPREFRTRLSQIPVGHVLEVVTSDPSAKEDLPSLARLLGHEVRSVEQGTDRRFRIRVERSK